MFKKVLIQSILYQGILMILLLTLIFSVVGVYEHQQMKNNLQQNLDKAEAIPFYEYFPEEGKADTVRYEKKIAAIYVWNNSLSAKISNDYFCPSKIKDDIIRTVSEERPEGRISSDGYYIAYRMRQKTNGYIVYVYDFTEDYLAYKNNVVLIIMMALMVSAIVIFFTIYFSKRNLVPIKSAFDKQKELVANASHELKTPLTILSTQADIVKEFDELTDEHKKWVEGMEEQVRRMSRLVAEILELARFEAVRNVDDYQVFNLSELVDKVLLGIEALAFENNVECVTDVVPRAMVLADPDGMEKVIYILLENALKYTPAGEKIIVKVYIDAHKVVLVVRNTGVACPKEEIPFLFDRFYRGDKSHPSTDNFGLGLSIAHAIVEANKGRIGCNSVDSEKQKYTEFIINLRNISNKQIIKKEKKNAKKTKK